MDENVENTGPNDQTPPEPENVGHIKQTPENDRANTIKPGELTAIAGMRLGSGVCNILAGVVFTFVFIIPIVLIPLGIVEIVSASNLLKVKPNRLSNPLTIPILEIIAILTLAGWISLVVGIVSLVFLADPRVKYYLKQL